MIRTYVSILFFGLSTCIGVASNYFFEKISPDEGFAFNEIKAIVVDKNDMIWFGCSNGLYNYNTDKIERFTTTTADTGNIISNFVNDLYIDHSQKLWVCTDKGFCIFNPSTAFFEPVRFKNMFQNENYDASEVLQISDSVYLCTISNRLYEYNKATGEIHNLYLTKRNERYRFKTLFEDQNGKIWLGLTDGSVYTTDKSLLSFQLFCKFRKASVTSFCIDNQYIWIGYDGGGADKVGINGSLFRHYTSRKQGSGNLLSNRVRTIIKRDNGDIWVGSYQGINVINESFTQTIVDDQFNNLPYKSIYTLLEDKQKGVWVGTWAGGLAYYSDYNYRFRHIKKIPFNSNYSKNTISSFAEEVNGPVWIGTENAGLKSFYEKEDRFESIDIFDTTGERVSIKSLAVDKNNRLWIGTFSNGLYYKDKGSNKIVHIENTILNGTFIIHRIVIDDQGIWLTTHGNGVYYYQPDLNKCTVYNQQNSNNEIPSNMVRTLCHDTQNNLWIGTDMGPSVKMANSETFHKVNLANGKFNSIIYSIYEVEEGKLWIATKDMGLLELSTDSMTLKKVEDEWLHPIKEIYNIITDNSANIWISSDYGIQMFDPRTGTSQNFNKNDGVLGKNFNPNASFKSSKGTLFFGSSNGFNIIKPNAIVQNPFVPNAFLSDLKINNKPFNEAKIKQSNSRFLPTLKEIALHYTQNSLQFTFVTNSYVKAYNNHYKYRLINYQDEWVESGTNNQVTFTKLKPGSYELQVLGSNNNGIWAKEPYSLKIRIVPPIWRTGVAYFIYLVFFGIIGFIIFREIYIRTNLKKDMLVERIRHDAEEKLFIEKQKFFTNISHEFRTPLTLILSPLNILAHKFKNDVKVEEHLNIIQRNADRLLRLTNEILDLRLIETGKFKLNMERCDVITVCKNAYDCFGYAAIEKEINFIFSSKFDVLNMDIDANKIEKVVYNLLSNAFKFSSDKSQIILSIDTKTMTTENYATGFYTGNAFMGTCVEIRLKDYGQGLKPEELPTIFERFSSLGQANVTGTGLGLHISQEYIKLHHGNIFVSSEQNKETTFVVNLPLDAEPEMKKQSIIVQPNFDNFADKQQAPTATNSTVLKKQDKVILVVEDHVDLRKYLRNVLMDKYKVLTASNGKQGYEIAVEIIPDLIISDVLMPGMDGITLTKKIKEQEATENIPIILLTALAEKSDQIHGITHGADSYLVKPVEIDLLLAHVNNLIVARTKISTKLKNKQIQGSKEKWNENGFLEKIEQLVHENLLNPQFSVLELSEKLSISRSSLHRRLKKEANQSVTEFIRDIRLKRAIEMMKEKKYNLDEISFYVGFNSHSYFTRTFKKKYGKTPKEFYDSIREDKPNSAPQNP